MNQRVGNQGQQGDNGQERDQKRAQDLLNQLMRDIAAKRRDIEAVLPADIKFEKFQACLNMAIRREPKLLECHGPTLIRAAIMSAYDGLLPDGREAVIVWRAMSYKLPNGSWAPKKRLEASYMPMAFGLRKKIIGAGAARHIKAVVVYAKEPFVHREGLNPVLDHEPLGTDQERGELRAVYSIATLPDGEREFEVMYRDDVMKVKAKAQTKDVWEGPFEPEMWRKTVLRRHSKALPTATPIRDAEAQVMFPDFSGQQQGAIAGGTAPARPTRADFPQLGAPEVELPLDLSGFGDDAVLADVDRAEQQEKPARRKKAEGGGEKQQTARKEGGSDGVEAPADDTERGKDAGGPAAADQASPALPRPADQAGWEAWQTTVLAELGKCTAIAKLNALQTRERQNIDAAPQPIARRVESSFLDMRVDLQDKGD